MSLSFNHDGLLPAGNHPLTLGELKDSVLVPAPSHHRKGAPWGIRDSHGHELLIPSAFRLQRGTDALKGIVQGVQKGRTS